MLLTFNLQQNNIQELSKKFSLLSNENHLKILLNLKEIKSVKEIHKLNLFKKYSSSYKALQKLVRVGLIKKEKGPNRIGDVYSIIQSTY